MLLKIIFGASLLLLAIATALFYIHLGGISNFFTVRLDTLTGINFLGGKEEVKGILISALAAILINGILSAKLYHRDRFLAHLLSFFSLFLALLILIAVGVIITIN